MNAPHHGFPVQFIQDLIAKHPPDPIQPLGCPIAPNEDALGSPCEVEPLFPLVLPEQLSRTDRWWAGVLASATFHGLVLVAVVLGGLFITAPTSPNQEVIGAISLDSLAGQGGSGGDGQAGGGSPAIASDPTPAATENLAPADTAPPQELAAEQPPQPDPVPAVPEPEVTAAPDPLPVLDPQLAEQEKKVTPEPKPEPKPVPKPKPKPVQQPRALPRKPVQQTAQAATPAKGPITTADATPNGVGTGLGTGQGDGSGEGPGKGRGQGDGPPGIGGGAGGSGSGMQFGQGDGPRFRHRSLPRYPSEAKIGNKEGRVCLRLSIDDSGVLRNVEVIEHTGLEFVEEALRAIKASTFYPAIHEGKAIMSRALLTIHFKLG